MNEARKNELVDPAHTDVDVDLSERSTLSVDPGFNVFDQLDLSPGAKLAAKLLHAKFPNEVVFTSGRRTIARQAGAMAKNVLSNRKWIEQTYKESDQRDELQSWIDNHPNALTLAELESGFKSVMDGWSDVKKRSFSRHITGHAFDVQPVPGEIGEEIKKAISELPNLEWYTFSEGGLERWHAQFHNVEHTSTELS